MSTMQQGTDGKRKSTLTVRHQLIILIEHHGLK